MFELHSRHAKTLALLTGGVLMASALTATTAPAQAADKEKVYKGGAIALGVLGAYWVLKGKTIPGAAAAAGAYYAYKKGKDVDKNDLSSDNYYGDNSVNRNSNDDDFDYNDNDYRTSDSRNSDYRDNDYRSGDNRNNDYRTRDNRGGDYRGTDYRGSNTYDNKGNCNGSHERSGKFEKRDRDNRYSQRNSNNRHDRDRFETRDRDNRNSSTTYNDDDSNEYTVYSSDDDETPYIAPASSHTTSTRSTGTSRVVLR